jgi:hypothetical protein
MTEKSLHRQVCTYLKYQYPDILFNTDLSGATKLTIGQAKSMKVLRSCKGWPDLFLAEPRANFHGLYLELKAPDTKLKKVKTDEWDTPHIAEQAEMLKKLNERGYCAEFAIGFDEAKELIDNYLKTK